MLINLRNSPRALKFVVFGVVCLMLCVNLTLTTTSAVAQKGRLILRSKPKGFFGTYRAKDVALVIETDNPSKEFSLTRIRKLDKGRIAEVLRSQDIVSITIHDVEITLDIENGRVLEPETLDGKLKQLEQFSRSEEAAQIRSALSEVILRRMRDEQPYLFGFLVLSMVFGDEPISLVPSEAVSKAPARVTALQLYAHHRIKRAEKAGRLKMGEGCLPNGNAQRMSSDSMSLNNAKVASGSIAPMNAAASASPVEGCMGCCGASCWGCTGCYTWKCYQHDYCVTVNGYYSAACWGLLADAVLSMANCE